MADLVCWGAGRSPGRRQSPVPLLSLPGAFAAAAIGARTGKTAVSTAAPSGEQSDALWAGRRTRPAALKLRGCD